MNNFKSYDYNQTTMVVVNFKDQIQENTFEYALSYLIDERIDLSLFYSRYKNESGGRIAYDPAILLKIILFAYSKGITSSREIQWCCEHNIIFKALSCDTVPHFTTIASFVSRHPDELADLFSQIVFLCDEEGLLGKELFAVDGCKMSSDASKEWSGTIDELTSKKDKIKKDIKRCVEEHKRTDKRKKGEKERAQRLEQRKDTLDKAFAKLEAFLEKAEPREGQGKRPKEVKSNITDNQSAKMKTSKGTKQGYNGIATVDQKHQVIVDAQAFGEGQEQHTLKPIIEALNTRFDTLGIDADLYDNKTIVTADTGFSSEENDHYLKENSINAYIPDQTFRERDPAFEHQKKKHGKRHQDTAVGVKQVIPSSEFTLDQEAQTCQCPAGNMLSLREVKELDYGKIRYSFAGKLSDCSQCPLNHECMRNPESAQHRKGNGRQVSFTVHSEDSASEWMKRRIDSPEGKRVYGHRMSVVEPVFANIGTNKRLDRFSLRGKDKVNGQWKLYCMVHNIEKLNNYGNVGAKAA